MYRSAATLSRKVGESAEADKGDLGGRNRIEPFYGVAQEDRTGAKRPISTEQLAQYG
jgi:hypothetical protein